MGSMLVEASMSLDVLGRVHRGTGYQPGAPAGLGGERLHEWRDEVAAMPISAVTAMIPVADFDLAFRWYEILFGRPADRNLVDGSVEWHLSRPGRVQVFPDRARAGQTAVSFIVDDLDEYLRGLAENGLTAGDTLIVSQGRERLASLTDPDGNIVSLIEVLP